MSDLTRYLGIRFGAMVAVCVAASGCGSPTAVRETPTPDSSVSVSDDKLRDDLDEIIEWTYHNRHLNLRDHAAWQILHGALAFKRDFLVERSDGQRVSAVDHLLTGGTMTGWVMRPGTHFDATGRRGLQAVLEVGSKTGQGHVDQWLAILAQCDLPPTQTIILDGETYTMEDFVSQALWDVPRNMDREYSWTLIALTTYLPTDHSWVAQDGQTWTIEQLLKVETEHDIHSSACGGTHRLSAIAMALNRHLDSGGKLEGAWKQADELIERMKQAARDYQNPDGSFSSHYLARPGTTLDLGQQLGSSGHVLEFLTLACTDAELREPWMTRAVQHTCQLLNRTKKIDLECGGLYHGLRGLILYRHRVYGPRDYPSSASGDKVATADGATTSDELP